MRAKGGMYKFVQKLSAKQRGQICHRCSEEIEDLTSIFMSDRLNSDSIKKCLPCHRDVRLLGTIKPIKYHLDKFETFLLSKKYDRYQFYILASAIAILIVSIMIRLFINNSFSLDTSNVILTIYWILYILRIKFAFK
jgi:hypothetical protein